MHVIDSLIVQEWLELAHQLQLFTRQQRYSSRSPDCHPSLGKRGIQNVFDEKRVNRFHRLRYGDGARRVQLIVAVNGYIDLVTGSLSQVVIGAANIPKLRAIQRVCELRRRHTDVRMNADLEGVKSFR